MLDNKSNKNDEIKQLDNWVWIIDKKEEYYSLIDKSFLNQQINSPSRKTSYNNIDNEIENVHHRSNSILLRFLNKAVKRLEDLFYYWEIHDENLLSI